LAESEERYYAEKCKPYLIVIAGFAQKEKELLNISRSDPLHAADKLFALSNEMLNLASYYLILNGLALTILKVRNEEALGEARKVLYKAVIFLENIVTNTVDAPYSEYEKQTKELVQSVNEQRRLELVQKMGLAINLLEAAYGGNSKWKWSFVELDGRFAAVSKNLIELSNIIANIDPRSPVYEVTKRHLAIVKRLLADVATRYRDRYSLSTQRVEDLYAAQNFLGALRYLYTMLDEREEAASIKKQYDLIQTKIDNDKKTAT
jgi:hypothetical protein